MSAPEVRHPFDGPNDKNGPLALVVMAQPLIAAVIMTFVATTSHECDHVAVQSPTPLLVFRDSNAHS